MRGDRILDDVVAAFKSGRMPNKRPAPPTVDDLLDEIRYMEEQERRAHLVERLYVACIRIPFAALPQPAPREGP